MRNRIYLSFTKCLIWFSTVALRFSLDVKTCCSPPVKYFFSRPARRPSGSNMPAHSVSRPLSITSAGWGELRDVCLPFMCDALGKEKPWRPLQLRSKSPILNANLVGSDYPCLEFLLKQAVIQIRAHLLWWEGFHRGDRRPCWDRGETWEGECGLLHMLPTIRKQFFSFMSRSKLVRQHMCWPWVLALQGMFPPPHTTEGKNGKAGL